jgi:hypothetical protein
MRAPMSLNRPGFFRKSTTSAISVFTPVYPATSSKVVLGRSVVYTLARLRPTFMIELIWPCARRFIQTKKPMIRPKNSSVGRKDSQMLPVSLANSSSFTLLRSGEYAT